MKNQAYRMAMLFDFYGDLLTERQREFYDLYYNDDLSLAEIAENYAISRQGVRDTIVRAERTLEDVEEKTGLIRWFHRTRAILGDITGLCGELEALNEQKLHDAALTDLCGRLRGAVEALEREE